jgi:RNA polymerase sigma-70 factor (ECF subfamily)
MHPQKQCRPSNKAAKVHFIGNDSMLTATLKQKAPYAAEEFYERYGQYIQRVLMRVLGVERNFADILQEVYVEIFSSISSIKDENCLKAWVTIFTARQNIKRIVRRRAILSYDDEKNIGIPPIRADAEAREAVHLTYRIMEEIPSDERIVFLHRFIEGMSLEETATACGVSRATVNRRLTRARQRFKAFIHHHPLLEKWINEGRRWRPEEDASQEVSFKSA